ncbi:hypothetical protein LMG27174_02496 [Paraburkholderia rhynchosiae]|uniref:Uncharacterized protein n=1 Tax=Paraburkholderia rhynchosiae TaxID=487049 RepID=A0A2N7WVX7_9BURK|nr:hypothetical protein C0Z16_03515 [Paraburkholderia rhynchosiae]CAB3678132.1 hypothetical protein LMG27174_02496 [Paraburkholderia rhynchosiae]
MNAAAAKLALDPGEHTGQFRIFRKRRNVVAMIALEITSGALVLCDCMAPSPVRSLDSGEQANGSQPVEDPVEGHAIHFSRTCSGAQIAGELFVRTGLIGALQAFEHGNGKRSGAQPRLAQARWPVGRSVWWMFARRVAGRHE